MTTTTLTIPTPVEIVPSDPGDRLRQINAQLQDGERLAREGQRLILSAIAQILYESRPSFFESETQEDDL